MSLIEIIQSERAEVRDRSLEEWCQGQSAKALLEECERLDAFRREESNLYARVRALFFLYAIYRFELPRTGGIAREGRLSFEGYEHLLQRRFEEAIDDFLKSLREDGPNETASSALASAYHQLAFQTLANQVRRSVRSVSGNRWMFRLGHPADQPLRVPERLKTKSSNGLYPLLVERTPVRMDLSHSGWSDIFFLGMDYPEGARVLNISIDLGVYGRDAGPEPPIQACLRVIDEPVLRLVSVDLAASADITELSEVFDFAKDYLGLLKAAVISAGLVPPGLEGSGQSLRELLARLVGPGRGLELVSSVRGIPKGSRLAVSTNLLASLIAVCMRATGQTRSLTGSLEEGERRTVAARAILGEWLGGSGGGWQDSGGVWPAIKLIQGVAAAEGDPEYGVSRGRLLPSHTLLGEDRVSKSTRERLQDSLVLVHGGMAQNVGPILEMVTEKYLLRSPAEWQARSDLKGLFEEILGALEGGDVNALGDATTRNFQGPLQTIIPAATNRFTDTLIARMQEEFGEKFWGFWMLGGMSGGGMGFIFDPKIRSKARERLLTVMLAAKRREEHALAFAMDPVVYDFEINENGTTAELMEGDGLLPPAYYRMMMPRVLRLDPRALPADRRSELDVFALACRERPEMTSLVSEVFDGLFPRDASSQKAGESLDGLLRDNGFDRLLHRQIQDDLKAGRIGLAQNRLPANTDIRDVEKRDVVDVRGKVDPEWEKRGRRALAAGEVGVVTLAAGAGSRWTQGAGVVKAIHPFAKLGGRHRTFLEVHLAKSRRAGKSVHAFPPHIVTSSYLTEGAIRDELREHASYGYPGEVVVSPGRSVGLRMVPTERDLRFAWEEMPQQVLDEQAQKVKESLHEALIGWARSQGEASDYVDNVPRQCLHPVGHWFEVPNLLRNGVLKGLLEDWPQLQYLLLHNIDTLGADLDPTLLGLHITKGSCLTFEVITRWIEDRGGGLARINGRPRLIEGLALPREEDEFELTYYNSATCWIHIDRLLDAFGLTRESLHDEVIVTTAVRRLAAKLPTYITLKDVKKRWGHGQEDVFPVTQWERLWGDMSGLSEVDCTFAVVPRERGQQLKDPAQLDGWLRDGSAAYVESLCDWGE
ncbi:MAG: UTP--glucose-1-phosphate uridylyltransferase [Planctomycetota bacterium]